MAKTTYSALVKLLGENGNFPNNSTLPVLFYKNVLKQTQTGDVKKLLSQNQWEKAWVDKIYPFHHYHSNTHEVLGICEGRCDVELGGPNGYFLQLERGDVLILPAGVSHRNIRSTENLTVVGAYPSNIVPTYNMQFGKTHERPKVDSEIKKTSLPDTDPIFGNYGLIFHYWRNSGN